MSAYTYNKKGYYQILIHEYGCWNVAKIEIFVIFFICMLYEVLFLLHVSYLCYMLYYILIIYVVYIICYMIHVIILIIY